MVIIETVTNELSVLSKTDITQKINSALVENCQNDNPGKCFKINSLISHLVTMYHTKGSKDTLIYKTIQSILASDPYIKHHGDLCFDDTRFVARMKRLNTIAKMQNLTEIKAELINFDMVDIHPNMLAAGELPLEVAIANDNFEMVKWLIERGAILYGYYVPIRKVNRHIPNIVQEMNFSLSPRSVNTEILTYIVERGAFGNAKIMIEFLYKVHQYNKTQVSFDTMRNLLNRFQYYTWRLWLGEYGDTKLLRWLKEFDHSEKHFTKSVESVFKEITTAITNNRCSILYKDTPYRFIICLFQLKEYSTVAQLLGIHNSLQPILNDYSTINSYARSTYDIYKHIEKLQPTDEYCILKLIGMKSTSVIAGAIEAGFKFKDTAITNVYIKSKRYPNILRELFKLIKIEQFTADMYSIPMMELIIVNGYSKDKRIIETLTKYNNLHSYNWIASYQLQKQLQTMYELLIMNKYV